MPPKPILGCHGFLSTNGLTDITNLPDACTNSADALVFGFAALGSIGDVIFWDDNGNGSQEWSEAGIGGVTVYICSGTTIPCNSGNALATTTIADGTGTDPIGTYSFSGLEPGDYTIGVEATASLISGADQTADLDRDGET